MDETMVCECKPGIEGTDCSIYQGCEEFNFCSSHGRCVDGACACRPGWKGTQCDIPINECPYGCSGRGFCSYYVSNEFHCICDPTTEGEACETAAAACPHGCSGHGLCVLNNESRPYCDCEIGYAGAGCSAISDPCGGCAHGYCLEGTCMCTGPYSGTHCDVYNGTLDTKCAALKYCNGHGVCVQSPDNEEDMSCKCFEMFGGAACDILEGVDTMCPNFCSGNGKCPYAQCECNPGWTGPDCATPACKSDEAGLVCMGRGVCEKRNGTRNGTTDYRCVCDKPFMDGPMEMCDRNQCPEQCSGHGECRVNSTCKCNTDWTGDDCSVGPTPTPTPTPEPEPTPSILPEPTATIVRITNATRRRYINGTAPTPTPVPTVVPFDPDAVNEDVDPPCPNDCSFHGQCKEGSCMCTDGYGGADCSIAPDVEDAEDDDVLLEMMEGLGYEEEQGPDPNSMRNLFE